MPRRGEIALQLGVGGRGRRLPQHLDRAVSGSMVTIAPGPTGDPAPQTIFPPHTFTEPNSV